MSAISTRFFRRQTAYVIETIQVFADAVVLGGPDRFAASRQLPNA
jgi:hypothetical protein